MRSEHLHFYTETSSTLFSTLFISERLLKIVLLLFFGKILQSVLKIEHVGSEVSINITDFASVVWMENGRVQF